MNANLTSQILSKTPRHIKSILNMTENAYLIKASDFFICVSVYTKLDKRAVKKTGLRHVGAPGRLKFWRH